MISNDDKEDSIKNYRIYVIIPAYNEESRVGEVVKSTLMQDVVSKVIVVNDCSTDYTKDEAASAGAYVISHFRNRGVGASIKTGYNKFLEEGGDIAVIIAGDGQHDPSEINELIKPIIENDADYVVGERLSGDITSMPLFRRFGNKLLSRITSFASGIKVADAQYGFTAIKRSALKKINIEYLTDRWGYPNDMIIECAIKGLNIKFVPSQTIYGTRKSYIKIPQYMIRVGTLLFRGLFRRIYFEYGIFLFNLIGIIMLFSGFVYGIIVSYNIIQAGKISNIGSLILIAVLLLGGMQMILFGFIVDMIKMLESKKN